MIQLYQIKGFHKLGVGATDDFPDVSKHNYYFRWNHNIQAAELVQYLGTDTYISNIIREIDGNSAIFTRNDDTTFTLPFGALAWQDEVEFDITLPGNTKVLYDNNGEIGGDTSFLYDPVTKNIKLTDTLGISARDTTRHSVYSNVFQYVGLRNVLINNDTNKTLLITDVFEDNIVVGHRAFNSVKNATKTIALGYKAAELVEGTNGGIYIGSYAGRLENEDNKLYIHNTDYATITEFRENSLLYGDFSIGLLTINNHLKVREEIQLGEYLGDTPLGGMLQFTDDGGGGVKPQYHDGTDWQDFANGLNYYLDGITKGTADVGTTSDSFKLTFSVKDTTDQVIQLGANAFNSIAIRSAHGTLGKIQLSNGSGDFTSNNLVYDSTDDRLEIGKIIKLTSVTDITAYNLLSENNDIIAYNNHIYSKLNGTLVRLDNEPTDGESNEGENLGTSIGLYAGMSVDRNLTFYGLKSGTRTTVNAADGSNDIVIDCNYEVTATSPVVAGVELISSVDDTDPDITNIILKRLISSDASVTFDIATPGVIDIQSTGAGGGESNVGVNVGTGTGIYKDKEAGTVNLRFYSLGVTSYGSLAVDTDVIMLTLDTLVSNVDVIGTEGESIIESLSAVGGGDDTTKLVLRKLQGISDIDITVSEDEQLLIGLDESLYIPSISFEGNQWDNGTKTLSFTATLNDNVRDEGSPTQTITVGDIIIGDLLTYNPTTNVLNATNQGLSGGDDLADINSPNLVYDEDGIVIQAESNTDTEFILESGAKLIWEQLGFLAFQNHYVTATSDIAGISKVGSRLTITDSVLNVPIATTDAFGVIKVGTNLSIDVDGKLNASLGDSLDAVLFDTIQYFLHDADEGNSDPDLDEYSYETRIARRVQARNNIGAAYVNGSREEAFKAAYININISEDGLTNGLTLYDNTITSDWGNVLLSKLEEFISIGSGAATVKTDTRKDGGGVVNFIMIDSNGDLVTVARLSPRIDSERGLVADWLVSGNFEFECTTL